MFIANLLNRFIKTGEQRSARIKKNILFSLVIRCLSVTISFLIVSLAIDYVNSVQYGIWLTLTSIMSWFTYFDFGMGNGLRNKLSTAAATEDYAQAKKYISTTYAIFAIISAVFFTLFFLVNPYINWNSVLNIPSTSGTDVHAALLMLSATLCVQFVTQLINVVLNAMHEPAKAELITFLGQAGMLLLLFVLKWTMPGDLTVLILALNIVPLVVSIVASFIFFGGSYKSIAPSFKFIDFSYFKNILNLGGTFFLIQIGSLLLFQTDNIVLARVLGPEAVTRFNVTYKLYYVIIIVFSIIASPFWSAFTEAYVKEDFKWIRNSVKKLREAWLLTSCIVMPAFFFIAKYLFRLFFPDALDINTALSLSMACYVIASTCLQFHSYFLFGVGKLRVLLILYLVVTISNIPSAIFLAKYMGVEGVVLANSISLAIMSVTMWVQTDMIMSKKASGIWNR